jgi:valyl-tRNA synthetase
LIEEKPKAQTIADEWILAKLDNVMAETTTDLKIFNFSSAADTLREFTRSDFADWYLEISKLQRQNSKLVESTEKILLYVLGKLLILWHPFIPFVTEEIWSNLGCEELLMAQQWPKVSELDIEQKEKNDKDIFYPFWKFEEIVMTIRNLRADFKVDPAKKVAVSIVGKNLSKIKFDEQKDSIIFLSRLDNLEVEKSKPKNSVSHVLEGVGEICLHLEGLVDLKKEKERIESEIKSVSGYIKSLEQKLKNKDFAKKAPKEVVEKEEFKLKEQKEKMEKLEEQLKSLK